MGQLIMVENLKLGILSFFDFVKYNIILLFLAGLFTYRTFFVGRLNYALLVLLISLFVIIICRLIYHYNKNPFITWLYRTLVLSGTALLFCAIGIQLLRIIYTFTTTFTEPTPAKILVRVGIVTTIFYFFALIFSFIYYLYVNELLAAIWSGSIERAIKTSSSAKLHMGWYRQRISTLIFLHILFWGGLLTIATLGIGFIAWLLR